MIERVVKDGVVEEDEKVRVVQATASRDGCSKPVSTPVSIEHCIEQCRCIEPTILPPLPH